MLNDKPKGKDYTVVMGNFNDVVGDDKEDAYQATSMSSVMIWVIVMIEDRD